MNGNLSKGLLAIGAIGVAGLLVLSVRHPSPPATPAIDATALLDDLRATKSSAVVLESVKRAAAAGDSCRYTEVGARAALDANLYRVVLKLLNAAPTNCPHAGALLGQRAEALARASDDDAKHSAKLALEVEPKNEYAELALAWLSYDDNQMKACSEHATNALALGRGAEADRLLGRAMLALGMLQEAEDHYQSVLKANPDDAEAAFSAAVCNDKLGHYSAAREGFLQTLRIDPKHVEARKYLVLLTYHAGAKAEAQHHLERLGELLPKASPTLAELQALLSSDQVDAGSPKSR